jgi:(R,R)-butanediol dehydrogenase/meso-butanediol dehydrogenase/diacetyl reductase
MGSRPLPVVPGGRAGVVRRVRAAGGGYAEYVRTRASQCVRLPCTASLATGDHRAAGRGAARRDAFGGEAARQGAGARCWPDRAGRRLQARRFGAACVVVQDIVPHQRAGAGDGSDRFHRRPRGRAPPSARFGGKADIVYECVGVPDSSPRRHARPRVKGTVLILGLCTRPDSFVPFEVLSKELRLQTSAFFKRQEFEAALDALEAGAAQPRLLVSDTIALEQVPASFEALKSRTHHCKVLIAP